MADNRASYTSCHSVSSKSSHPTKRESQRELHYKQAPSSIYSDTQLPEPPAWRIRDMLPEQESCQIQTKHFKESDNSPLMLPTNQITHQTSVCALAPVTSHMACR